MLSHRLNRSHADHCLYIKKDTVGSPIIPIMQMTCCWLGRERLALIFSRISGVYKYISIPGKAYWEAVKCISEYDKGTQRKCICYGHSELGL